MSGTATAADRVSRALAEAIVDGSLPPGSRLDEEALAARFMVSRTPVREALRDLAARGLAQAAPRRGMTVARVGVAEVADLLDAECELEGLCARLAAGRMGAVEQRDLERLHEAAEAPVRRGELAEYLVLNAAFHEAICAGARNGHIGATTRALRDRLGPLRGAGGGETDRLARSWTEHGAILAAILAADGGAAGEAMRAHNARLSANVLHRLREAAADAAPRRAAAR